MARRDLARTDATSAPALGTSRSRVLEVLQTQQAALGVEDIAARVGLHGNTVRFHLEGLVDAGLAHRTVEARDQPGRPRTMYTASAAGAPAGRRSYRLLAEILTSYLAGQSTQPAREAEDAGIAWGRFLTERPEPFGKVDVEQATQRLIDMLDDVGFEPEAVRKGRKREVLLHHCPFRETAERHRDVVCSVHLGLMRGMLGELDAPLEVQKLDAFVEPDLCVAHLTRPSVA